jgi:hypothetical protein
MKIKVYHTRYASLRENAALFCVKPENLDRVLALEGARATKLSEDGYPVISLEYGTSAWKASTS